MAILEAIAADAVAVALGVGEERLRLIDAEHDGAARGERAGDAAVARRRVEDAAAGVQPEDGPQPVDLGGGARAVVGPPDVHIVVVEEGLPPFSHERSIALS